MKKTLTITTDLNDGFAISQLHAVLVDHTFNGGVIENHDVKSFSIIEGAYGIWQLIKYCPNNTVNLGIVDPGVGGSRYGIVIKTKNFWFVGPNNGLFYPAAKTNEIEAVWKIDESYFGKVSNTFHGRDVFIKTAILLAKNKKPDQFGCKKIHKKSLVQLNFKNGQIVHIDAYGNLKVWGRRTFNLPLVKTFSDVETGKPLVLSGSSDILEIAINQSSAEKHFGVKLDQVLEKL